MPVIANPSIHHAHHFYFFFLPLPLPFFFLLRFTQSFRFAVIASPNCLYNSGSMRSDTSNSITCGSCLTARSSRYATESPIGRPAIEYSCNQVHVASTSVSSLSRSGSIPVAVSARSRWKSDVAFRAASSTRITPSVSSRLPFSRRCVSIGFASRRSAMTPPPSVPSRPQNARLRSLTQMDGPASISAAMPAFPIARLWSSLSTLRSFGAPCTARASPSALHAAGPI
mmetsp:Transcript_11110/g.29412  ORF Transcript_11110/g.29412 Transcript_11110/m.29412 type:complete len:227 (-) Transcript_11110:414-1094(-)